MIKSRSKLESGFRSESGFTYIEILITIGVIAVALIPIMDSLRTSVLSSGNQQDYIVKHYHLFAKMEEVMAEPYANLSAAANATSNGIYPSAYSEYGGDLQRWVFISHYDVDNLDGDGNPMTGTDDVLWVRSFILNTNIGFETLVMK